MSRRRPKASWKRWTPGGFEIGQNLEVKRYWMDTYRVNATAEAMEQQGKIALAEIAEFKPEIVFICDDAAVAQVMMPLVEAAPRYFRGVLRNERSA